MGTHRYARTCLVACMVLGLVAAPVSVAQAFAASAANVDVSVVDAQTSLPLAGAVLRLVDLDTGNVVAQATSTSEGSAQLPTVPAGTYHVVVQAPEGFVSTAGPLLEVGPEEGTIELSVSLVQGGQVVRGVVQSVVDSTITLEDGTVIQTDEATNWTGALISVDAIYAELEVMDEDGEHVCIEYIGTPQADGSILATSINAWECEDDEGAWLAGVAAALVGGLAAAGLATTPEEEPITQ